MTAGTVPNRRRILVLNPNSSRLVTGSLHDALPRYQTSGLGIDVEQLDAAPTEIASPADHEAVSPLVVERVANVHDYDAVIVACHGDPGVRASRELTAAAVLGIGESSLRAAAAVTDRFAVLTLSDALIDRKWSQVREAGADGSCVAVVPTRTGVEHGLRPDPELIPYLAAARTAIDAGAQLVILGCAGMSPLTSRLSTELGIPVLDPVALTLQLAIAVVGAQGTLAPGGCIER